MITCASIADAQANAIERSESIALNTGTWLSLTSNKQSIQSVEIRGNLSAATLSAPSSYPTDALQFTSSSEGRYSLRVAFECPTEYNVTLSTAQSSEVESQMVSYYVSSGELILNVDLNFSEPDPKAHVSSISAWEAFSDWTARFGDAFPLWVKLLYLLLGVQFLAVGYKWIQFEDASTEETSLRSRLDTGNLLYLWTEIVYKFLLTSFIMIGLVMGGQLLLLSALRFMFLAPVNMLSLWDLFVLGFAGAVVVIAYVLRFFLERSLDLKPLFQD